MEMREDETTTLIMISAADLESMKLTLQKILNQMLLLKAPFIAVDGQKPYITAIEFMKAVSIKRTKLDDLIARGKIRIVKKKRRIYVPIEEVDRFFKDSTVQ